MKKLSIETIRHSMAHIMAAALQELFPEAKFGVGPVIDKGFYYDFEMDRSLTPQDLPKIEKRMKKIIARNLAFEKDVHSLDDAIAIFKKLKQPYKVELLQDLKKRGTTKLSEEEAQDIDPVNVDQVSVYRTGEFVDLCRGPHVEQTKQLGVFKLSKLAGAYWRGDEKKPMLQRIYGLAFHTQEELDQHLAMLEEAKKRDHRILGQELDLFITSPLVGSGLPLFTPKGTIIRSILEDFLKDEQVKRGYLPVWTSHLAKTNLFEMSGHWPYYKDDMYPPMQIDTEQYLMKPMNCPLHIQVYKSRQRSYRDLPLRYSEFGTVYRYEKSGELTGLTRVRALTIDDAHMFVRPDQLEAEFVKVIDLTFHVLKKLKLSDVKVRLSLHDPKNRKKYVGSEEVWQQAEDALRKVLLKKKLDFYSAEGEAAFYGPKIDFIVKDVIGREWQMGTVQLDYNLPERFDMAYIGEDGQKHRPVMIHRAPFGSIERFMAILIEHFAGAFPTWLAPVQVALLPVGKDHLKAANELAEKMQAEGIRAEVHSQNETIGYKIRATEKAKVPYMLVIGDKEAKGKKLTVRIRGKKNTKEMTVKQFIDQVKQEIEKKK